MKRNYYDIIEYKIFKAQCKTEALKFLFEKYQDTGSASRDSDAMAGISFILEDISNESRKAYEMLSDTKRPPLDTKIEDTDCYMDGYPSALTVENRHE